MGRTSKTNEPPKTDNKTDNKTDAKPKKPPPEVDDDYEDGDIATPKRDRYGTDDEPL